MFERMLDTSATSAAALKKNAPIFAIGGGLVAASFAAAPGVVGGLGGGLAVIMLAIAAIDARRFIIPDPLNAAGFVLGLVHAFVLGQGDILNSLAVAVLRAVVLGLSFLALRVIYARLRGREGIGLGDVKLAAVAGAWLDGMVMPVAIEIAAVSALAAYALRYYLWRRPLRPTTRLPFGLFFAPAIWVAWLLQAILMQSF
jgi:leader peptidase (prepilin peptidase)/N-methyltransferase